MNQMSQNPSLKQSTSVYYYCRNFTVFTKPEKTNEHCVLLFFFCEHLCEVISVKEFPYRKTETFCLSANCIFSMSYKHLKRPTGDADICHK